MPLHHATLFVGDAEWSVRFYRDGLGFTVLMDREFDPDWPALFGVTSPRLRAMVLGDPDNPQLGQIELVTFTEACAGGPAAGSADDWDGRAGAPRRPRDHIAPRG